MIKVVLRDIDGTLLDFSKAEKDSIRNSFNFYNLGELTDQEIELYTKINGKWWEKLERNEVSKQEVLVGRYRDFLSAINKDPLLAEKVNDKYEDGLCDYIYQIENAEEVLKKLKGKVLQCAVTNGVKRIQDAKLSKTGFDKLFDYIFISEVVGFEKPNIEFYKIVEKTIGFYQKDEILIIGDSLTSDIKLGQNAGIKTCYFNPHHKIVPSYQKIDYVIDDLRDVLKIIY